MSEFHENEVGGVRQAHAPALKFLTPHLTAGSGVVLVVRSSVHTALRLRPQTRRRASDVQVLR